MHTHIPILRTGQTEWNITSEIIDEYTPIAVVLQLNILSNTHKQTDLPHTLVANEGWMRSVSRIDGYFAPTLRKGKRKKDAKPGTLSIN